MKQEEVFKNIGWPNKKQLIETKNHIKMAEFKETWR
jgi:hypothetical protein